MSAEGRPTALTMNPVWLLHLETVLAWAEEVSPEPTLERALAASTGDLVPEDVTLARLYLMGGPVGVADSQLPVAQQIDELLGHVDSRSKDVLFSRLFSNQAETLSAIGETLGVTRARVQQIEKAALRKVRKGFIERGYTPEVVQDWLDERRDKTRTQYVSRFMTIANFGIAEPESEEDTEEDVENESE